MPKAVTEEARVDALGTVKVEDLAVKSDAELDAIEREIADSPYYDRDLAPAGPSRPT